MPADAYFTTTWMMVPLCVTLWGQKPAEQVLNELYRSGIDRTKLQHWAAAHDVVAANVAPAIGSRWTAQARDFVDVEDPRTLTAAQLSNTVEEKWR